MCSMLSGVCWTKKKNANENKRNEKQKQNDEMRWDMKLRWAIKYGEETCPHNIRYTLNMILMFVQLKTLCEILSHFASFSRFLFKTLGNLEWIEKLHETRLWSDYG